MRALARALLIVLDDCSRAVCVAGPYTGAACEAAPAVISSAAQMHSMPTGHWVGSLACVVWCRCQVCQKRGTTCQWPVSLPDLEAGQD